MHYSPVNKVEEVNGIMKKIIEEVNKDLLNVKCKG